MNGDSVKLQDCEYYRHCHKHSIVLELPSNSGAELILQHCKMLRLSTPVQSTTHQGLHFWLCAALISRALTIIFTRNPSKWVINLSGSRFWEFTVS
jgi:hypothetical protein